MVSQINKKSVHGVYIYGFTPFLACAPPLGGVHPTGALLRLEGEMDFVMLNPIYEELKGNGCLSLVTEGER